MDDDVGDDDDDDAGIDDEKCFSFDDKNTLRCNRATRDEK